MPVFHFQLIVNVYAEPKLTVGGSTIFTGKYWSDVWVRWQQFNPTSNGKCQAKIDERRFNIGFSMIQKKGFVVDKAALKKGRAVVRAKVKGIKWRIN